MPYLPQYGDGPNSMQLMQNSWATILNPLLALPLNSSILLTNIKLTAGSNAINHLLSRQLRGWVIVRMVGSFSQVYEVSAGNKILTLNASAPTTISLLVF